MAANSNKYSKARGPEGQKVYTEAETRRKLITLGKNLGFEHEVRTILDQTDQMLRGCTNTQERQQIALFGIVQIQKLLGNGDQLIVDGKKII